MIFLERAYPPDERATLGSLVIDDWTCHTLERPWIQNQRNISCIPEGTYSLGLRPSPLISRITKGKYDKGWEVQNVIDRTFIMFHHGNWVEDTQGCILVGRKAEWTDREGHMVTSSYAVFEEFMRRMNNLMPHELKLVIITRGFRWDNDS